MTSTQAHAPVPDWAIPPQREPRLSEMLMVASGPAVFMVVGALGGGALIAEAWWRSAARFDFAARVLMGTLPLAILGWAAGTPLLLGPVAWLVAFRLARRARAVDTAQHAPIRQLLESGLRAGARCPNREHRIGPGLRRPVMETFPIVASPRCTPRPTTSGAPTSTRRNHA